VNLKSDAESEIVRFNLELNAFLKLSQEDQPLITIVNGCKLFALRARNLDENENCCRFEAFTAAQISVFAIDFRL
jgi:hypothetical protein